MSQPPRRPGPPRLGRHAATTGLLAVLPLLCVVCAAPSAWAAGAKEPAGAFGQFVAAWKARSTSQIVGCLDPKGKVVFSLFAYPLSGKVRVMGPEQTTATLKIYFKRVTSVSLKDITPKKSPKNVRWYEYAYKASGENARTTHLQVKLKRDKKSLWVLASVIESAKPPAPRK